MITTIILSGILLSLVIAVIIYLADVDFILKLTVLPFAIFFLSVSGLWIKENIGSPIEGMPQGEFEMLHYKMKSSDTIHLWVWEKTRGSRVYFFPYDRETLKKLMAAEERQKAGFKIRGKMMPPNGAGGELRMELEATMPDRTQGPSK